MKKTPALQVEEVSGNRFSDRSAAQKAALPLLSENLQVIMRDLLERGVLVNINGKIIPNPKVNK